jgi:hypothetical protein
VVKTAESVCLEIFRAILRSARQHPVAGHPAPGPRTARHPATCWFRRRKAWLIDYSTRSGIT